MARRAWWFVPLLVAALLAGPASAGKDPAAAGFAKLSKAAQKSYAAFAKAEVKTLAGELSALLAELSADDGRDAGEVLVAMSQHAGAALAALALQADAALQGLSLQGADILSGALAGEGTVPVGRDFQPGGRGVWDDALRRLAAAHTRSESQVRKQVERFLRTYRKRTAAQGLAPRPRVSFGPPLVLGDGLLSPVASAEGDSITSGRRSQVLIETKLLSVSSSDTILHALGISWSDSVSLRLNHPGGTQDATAPVSANRFETVFTLAEAPGGPYELLVEPKAADGPDQTRQGSLPHRIEADPALLAPVEKQFRVRLRQEASFFGRNLLKNSLRALGKSLAGIARDHGKGDLDTEEALTAANTALGGFSGDIGLFGALAVSGPVTEAQQAFASAKIGDDAVPETFVPDGGGHYDRFLALIERRLQAANAKVDRLFRRFLDRVEQGAAEGEGVNGAVISRLPVLGRLFDVDPPDVTPLVFEPQVLHGMVHLQLVPDASTTFYGGGWFPAAESGTLETTLVVEDGNTIVLGAPELVKNPTLNSFRAKVPALGDLPLVGMLFRAGGASSNGSSAILVVTPHLVAPGPK